MGSTSSLERFRRNGTMAEWIRSSWGVGPTGECKLAEPGLDSAIEKRLNASGFWLEIWTWDVENGEFVYRASENGSLG
jgi:hypothetical protein